MENISAHEAAKLLGISVDKLSILEKQGVLHAIKLEGKQSTYSAKEIAQIKSRRGLTLSEEADRVNAEIQLETVSSISKFRKILILTASLIAGYLLLVAIFTFLFIAYPLQTSNFFGYYYRYNAVAKPQTRISIVKGKSVLAAETGATSVSNQSSVLADVIKPAAAASLIAVKAIDGQKFSQIVTNPVEAAGLSGQVGSPGPPGPAGSSGISGADGAQGPAGSAGSNGSNGVNGTNGSNGTNGTSVADVLTAPGGIIIRDLANTTVQLSPGSNGQILTIAGGIPAWENAGGSGVTVLNTLTGALTIAGGGINTVSTLGSTITVTGTLPAVGTAGTYGSALYIPVLTTDAQGRVTGVTNTAIAGLTNANLSGAAGITNANLANSSVNINSSGILTGGGVVFLGGTINLTATEADTLASVTGRGASTSTALTLNGGVTTTTTTALMLDSGTTGAVSIGTGASAKTVSIGNTTGATRLNLNAGTGGLFVNGLAAQTNGKLTVCIDNATKRLFTGASAGSCNTSSARFKHDIENIALGLDTINALHPVSYAYNSNDEKALGFIAEEVGRIDERLIVRDAQGLPYALNSDEFIPILTKGLQELDSKVEGIGLTIESNSRKGADTAQVSPAEETDTSTLVSDIQHETIHDPIILFSQKIAEGKNFLVDFISARVTAIRGYFDEVFAKKVHTDQLCIKKSDGSEICVTGDQVDTLLQQPDAIQVTSVKPTPNLSPDVTPEIIPSPTQAQQEPTFDEIITATASPSVKLE